jgi:hypothetical protein
MLVKPAFTAVAVYSTVLYSRQLKRIPSPKLYALRTQSIFDQIGSKLLKQTQPTNLRCLSEFGANRSEIDGVLAA